MRILRSIPKVLLAAVVAAAACPRAHALTPQMRVSVQDALRSGNADDALQTLHTALGQQPNDAEAHALLCRVFYGEERWDEAIRECQQAVALDPNNSDDHLWLGRAYGEKADRISRTSFVTAFGLGKKVHSEFETAVKLNPANVAALADLGEFYTEAPGIVGGGIPKAEAVAAKLDTYDRARAEVLRAGIAWQRKDFAAAEQHYRAAIAAAPQPADYWMTLASFYARQQQWDKMRAAIDSGIDADKNHGAALVDAAHILTRSQRDPQLAIQLLREYLASPNKSADEPAYRVHAFLAQLLEAQGSGKEAQQQIAAATALASGYRLSPNTLVAAGR